jgi:hypothetical protein
VSLRATALDFVHAGPSLLRALFAGRHVRTTANVDNAERDMAPPRLSSRRRAAILRSDRNAVAALEASARQRRKPVGPTGQPNRASDGSAALSADVRTRSRYGCLAARCTRVTPSRADRQIWRADRTDGRSMKAGDVVRADVIDQEYGLDVGIGARGGHGRIGPCR